MADPVATFAEASQAKRAAERGGMEVIATAGPSNISGTLTVQWDPNSSFHSAVLEVTGTGTSDGGNLTLNAVTNIALLRGGTWITSAAGEQLAVWLSDGTDAGETLKVVFPLSIERVASAGASQSEVTVEASNGSVDSVQLRVLAVTSP